MSFRSNDEIEKGRERAIQRFISREIPGDQRGNSEIALDDLILQNGPIVESYPSWHPLISWGNETAAPYTTPRESGLYQGLDHLLYFQRGFLSCPYGGQGDDLINSVEKLMDNPKFPFVITAQRLSCMLYHPGADPVLVRWEEERLCPDGSLRKDLVTKLILDFELRALSHSECGETWNTMRPYLMGSPCGARSSLFVNQETGQFLKRLWNTLNESGIFGPVKMA